MTSDHKQKGYHSKSEMKRVEALTPPRCTWCRAPINEKNECMCEYGQSQRTSTTPSEAKREWWIDERPDVDWDAAFRKNWGSSKYIHVVEYSALEAAQAKCSRMEEHWREACRAGEAALKERDIIAKHLSAKNSEFIDMMAERDALLGELNVGRAKYAARFAKVCEERDEARETYKEIARASANKAAQLTQANELLEIARAALEFYADKKSYEGGHNTDGGHTGIDIDNNGDLARDALTKLQRGEGT